MQFSKDLDIEFRHNLPGWAGSMTSDSNPNAAFLMMQRRVRLESMCRNMMEQEIVTRSRSVYGS